MITPTIPFIFCSSQNSYICAAMNISVVIPLYNEEESLPELCEWIERVMIAFSYTYEIILVDDGSKDKSWQVIEHLAAKNQNCTSSN